MTNNQKKIQAYKALLDTVDKYPDELKEDFNVHQLGETLSLLKMQERFGIPLRYRGPIQYDVEKAYDNWTHVAMYGKGNREISWPDCGTQPDNEWLYCIQFTTGAYSLGSSYPTETFEAMWNELKSYEPKYMDTNNHSLYFTEDKTKLVYDNFWLIFNKYSGMVKSEVQRQRKKELEYELAKLNESAV